MEKLVSKSRQSSARSHSSQHSVFIPRAAPADARSRRTSQNSNGNRVGSSGNVSAITLSSGSFYEKVKKILDKTPEDRKTSEIQSLEIFFRKKSRLFSQLDREPLQDVIKNCAFRHVVKDTVLIQQGYTGNRYDLYIILRGQVSIMFKESQDDSETDALTDIKETERHNLGIVVGELREGKTFGELSLITDDSVRTATYITDEPTDLIVVGRDVFHRSVASIVNDEYQKKMTFIQKTKWFIDWAPKWRRELAECISTQSLSFDEVLVQQGHEVTDLFFVVKGELKLIVNPESHNRQFADILRRSSRLIASDSQPTINHGLAGYLSQTSSKAKRLRSAHEASIHSGEMASTYLREHQLLLSPSESRKLRFAFPSKRSTFNMCFIEPGQLIGDVEMSIGLSKYHTSALSTSHDTVVVKLPKAQYERLFVKKNPQTVDKLCHNVGFHVQMRLASELIQKNVPLLKAIMLYLDAKNGTYVVKRASPPDDDGDESTEADFMSLVRSDVKSGYSSKSAPPTGRKPKMPDIDNDPVTMVKQPAFGHFSSLPDAFQKYLNTQIQHALYGEAAADEPGPVIAEHQRSDNGVYTMAQHNAKASESKTKLSPQLNPRSGIFFKMLQVSNPHIDKKDLAIEEDEYTYLCQLRKRLAKQIKEFYPFASLESFLKLGDDVPKTGRLCRRGQFANQSIKDQEKEVEKQVRKSKAAAGHSQLKAVMKQKDDEPECDKKGHVRFS